MTFLVPTDSHLPPSKRLLREDGGGPLPLRPRRILHNKTKDDQPLIQLYWPVSHLQHTLTVHVCVYVLTVFDVII